MLEKELETIRYDFSASYTAEKNGFYLGIRTALTMFVEAMQLWMTLTSHKLSNMRKGGWCYA